MTPHMNRLVSFLALFVTLGLAVLPAKAQQPQYPYAVDTKPSRGIMPNSEQLSGPLDHIDPVTGKLHIQIPLASLPAGNAGSGFDLAMTYDSHVYDMGVGWITKANGETVLSQTVTPTLTGGGWSYNFKNYRVEFEDRRFPPNDSGCGNGPFEVMEHERTFRYRISLPDGSQHLLHLLGYGDEKDGYYGDGFYAIDIAGRRSYCASQHPGRYSANVTGKLTYYTTDGSYLRFEINADGSNWTNQQWTLFYPDGRRVVGRYDQAEHLYDANGNGIHITNPIENGHAVSYIADDFNRGIRVEHSLTSSATEREDKITVAGPNGTLLEWRVKWQRIQIGGPGASYVCYEDTSVNPPDPLSCPFNFGNWAVKYIQLPLASPDFTPPPAAPWTNFEFTHTTSGVGYGRLTSMRVPSGAVYSYCCDSYNSSLYAQDIAYGGYVGRTVSHDGVNEVWGYQWWTPGLSIVINPDGGQTVYHSYDPQIASQYWSRGLVYWIEEPGGTVRKRQWTRNKVSSLAAAINIDSNNPYVERESVTVDNVVGEPRSAVTDHLIDKNGNLLRKTEYGWSAALAGSAMENPGPLLRTTETSYYVSVPASTDASNGTNRYWNPLAPPRLNAAARATVSDESSTVKAATEFTYDDALTKGNLTWERRWDDETPDCTNAAPLPVACPAQQRKYDANGNLIEVLAPAIPTVVTYGNGPHPTKVEYAVGTPSYRSFRYDWNLASGTLNYQVDEQNGITTWFGYDQYGRQSFVNEAGLRITRTEYHEEHRSVLVKHDLRTFDDSMLQTISRTDQLGRVELVRTSDGLPLSLTGNDGIKLTTSYQTFDGGTRVFTSSPYRNAGEAGMQWTCTERDQSGRVVIAAQFTGATAPTDCQPASNRTGATVTDYHVASGTPRTRVTDPAGKVIDNFSDALGRLTTVVEDPAVNAFSTTYLYGVFDNLRSSTQTGSGVTQQRQFTYSSLGRLTTATNPETGMITFTYKPSGDLHTRLDARNFLTTLDYDDLHRVKSKSFSNDGDVTPDVAFEYHTAAPCIGQLKSVISAAGTSSNSSCDPLGRVLGSAQSIAGADGGSYNFSYTYWLNDSLKTVQYPSGKLVNYDVDNAGRAVKVHTPEKTFADLTTASTPPYRADGRLEKMKLGNGLWETRNYQVPGTATVLSLGTSEGAADRLELQYNYAASSNNGNLLSHVIRQGATAWSQTYDYDGLNRLICATETTGASPASSCTAQNSWRQTYGYDRFGNRWVDSSSGFSFGDVHEFITENFIDKTNNRIVGQGYDLVGNLTTYSPWSMTYDAENRMTALSSASNGNSTFTYDGSGRRIKKVTTIPSPQTTLYVYDAGGRLAAEYSTTASPSGTSYLFADLLGTPRAITAANGSLQECSDYSPFGRLLQTSTRSLACHQIPSHASQQFTGQVRDQETKLDYFGARYYSGAQGRWLSPDTPFADQHPGNPQSWNLYSYTRNNPLNAVDADGRQTIKVDGPQWKALPEDGVNRRFTTVAIGALKGIGLMAVDLGRAMGMPDQNASKLEDWLSYSNKREQAVGTLTQWYQAGKGVQSAAAAGVGIVKGVNAARKIIKAAETTAVETKTITVLGSGTDVAKYATRPGFNVLNMDDLPMSEWGRQNAQWLNKALHRGDEIWLVTDPIEHARLMQRLGKNSYYLDLELPMLNQYSGVNPVLKYKEARP